MKSLVLAALAVALTGTATPAEAAGYGGSAGYQPYYGFPGSIYRFVLPYRSYGGYGHGYGRYHAAPVLPARQVIRLLRRFDYRHVRHLTLYGGVYRAQARDRRGRRVNLIVDAYTGVIIAARYAY